MKRCAKRRTWKNTCNNKCSRIGRTLWNFAMRKNLAMGKYGLKPNRQPILPSYFINLGLAELGWKNRVYGHVLYGSWAVFAMTLLIIILVVTIFFWIPIYIIYSMDTLSITNVNEFWDTVALAFSTLLNIQTQYVPTSPGAIIALAIESGFGRFILAAVTAILVVKASKVQNNIVLSENALIHKKPDGFWYISVRVGCLYDQNIFASHIRLTCITPINCINEYHGSNGNGKYQGNLAVNLKLYDALEDGEFQLGGIPRNVRHRIDEQSPLYDAIKNFGNPDQWQTTPVISALYLHFNGIDELTGRGVGKSRVYTNHANTIKYYEHGRLQDVILPPTRIEGAIRRGSVFGHLPINIRNDIALNIANKLKDEPSTELSIYWSNFHLIRTEKENDMDSSSLSKLNKLP